MVNLTSGIERGSYIVTCVRVNTHAAKWNISNCSCVGFALQKI